MSSKRTNFKMSMRDMRMAALEATTHCRKQAKEAHWSVAGYWMWLDSQWDRIYINIAGGLVDLATARCMFAELSSRIDGVECDADRIQLMEEMHDQNIVSLDFEKRKREKLQKEAQKAARPKDATPKDT